MANYSKDSDLAIYERDVASLQFDLAELHTEAKREIDRRLRARGLSDNDIAALTAQTIADLIPVSCSYVLYLAYASIGAHETAKTKMSEFRDRLDNTRVEVSGGTDGTEIFSGGTLMLG